jgi:hypothetical protein
MTGALEPEDDGTAPQIIADIWRWAKRQAIGQMDLSWGARECWRILEAFPPGQCYPSHWYIAERLRRTRSAVRRYLRELNERGYIEISPRYDDDNTQARRPRANRPPRGQTSNDYVVLDQPDLIAAARQIVQDWKAKQHQSKG